MIRWPRPLMPNDRFARQLPTPTGGRVVSFCMTRSSSVRNSPPGNVGPSAVAKARELTVRRTSTFGVGSMSAPADRRRWSARGVGQNARPRRPLPAPAPLPAVARPIGASSSSQTSSGPRSERASVAAMVFMAARTLLVGSYRRGYAESSRSASRFKTHAAGARRSPSTVRARASLGDSSVAIVRDRPRTAPTDPLVDERLASEPCRASAPAKVAA